MMMATPLAEINQLLAGVNQTTPELARLGQRTTQDATNLVHRLFWLGLALVLILLAGSVLAALTAECFTPRLRYSGASIGFQLAAVFAGGPAPLIATALLASTGSGQVIALYIFGCAIVSIAATAALPSSRDRDFARDHL